MIHFGSLGRTWLHLIRLDWLGLTWFDLISFGLAWFHWVSIRIAWIHFVSVGFTWLHLLSLGLSWIELLSVGLSDSLGFTWPHLVSIGLKWADLVSLGLIRNRFVVPDLIWSHLASLGLTWYHMAHLDSLGFICSHLDLRSLQLMIIVAMGSIGIPLKPMAWDLPPKSGHLGSPKRGSFIKGSAGTASPSDWNNIASHTHMQHRKHLISRLTHSPNLRLTRASTYQKRWLGSPLQRRKYTVG